MRSLMAHKEGLGIVYRQKERQEFVWHTEEDRQAVRFARVHRV